MFVYYQMQAQTVFAPQGAVWYYLRYGEGDNFSLRYATEKDTLVKGQNCSKVIGVQTNLDGTKLRVRDNFFYTDGDTVFFYHESLGAFTPLYIFNAQVGDTLKLASPLRFYSSFKHYKVVVEKIDTIYVGAIPLRNIYSKVIEPFSFYTVKWTERIGGYQVADIIAIIGPTTADHVQMITCYHDDDIDRKFVSDTTSCDFIPTKINEKQPSNSVSIYPNPCTNTLNIAFSEQLGAIKINIYSVDGRLVQTKWLQQSNNALNISDLSPGLYLLQIQQYEKELQQFYKLVKEP